MVYNPSSGNVYSNIYKVLIGAAAVLADDNVGYNAATRHLPGMRGEKPSPLEITAAEMFEQRGQKPMRPSYVAPQMRIPFHRGVAREARTSRAASPQPVHGHRTPRGNYRKVAERR